MKSKMHFANYDEEMQDLPKKLLSYKHNQRPKFNDLKARSTIPHPLLNNRIRLYKLNSLTRNDCLNWINTRKQQGAWQRMLKKHYTKLLVQNEKLRMYLPKKCKERLSPTLENTLEELSPPTPMKTAAEKIRAFVFDVLYGSGAHRKSLIFLTSYKIPKLIPPTTISEDLNDNGDKNSHDSLDKDSNSSDGETCYSVVTIDISSTSSSHAKDEENSTNNEEGEKSEHGPSEDNASGEGCNNSQTDLDDLDILVITAEDDDFLFLD